MFASLATWRWLPDWRPRRTSSSSLNALPAPIGMRSSAISWSRQEQLLLLDISSHLRVRVVFIAASHSLAVPDTTMICNWNYILTHANLLFCTLLLPQLIYYMFVASRLHLFASTLLEVRQRCHICWNYILRFCLFLMLICFLSDLFFCWELYSVIFV